jgi:hypothetical protein
MLAARRAGKFEWLLEDDDVEEGEEEAAVGRRGRAGVGWNSDFRDEERRIESLVRRYKRRISPCSCSCCFRRSWPFTAFE